MSDHFVPHAGEPAASILLSTRAAGKYLSVSRATLFRAARRGDLNPVRLGSHFTRWSRADLDAWIARAATSSEGGVA